MFSLFGKNKHDAFEDRQKQQRVWRSIRRIIDMRSSRDVLEQDNRRIHNRFRRYLPVAFFPAHQDEVEATHCVYGITKDFSDNGLSLILKSEVPDGIGVCGFWLDEPIMFAAVVRREVPFGGDMVELGIELTEVIDSRELHILLHDPLLRLSPRHASVHKTHCEPVTAR